MCNFAPTVKYLRCAAAIILVLNLADAVLTLAIYHTGLAGEANPLMEVALASWGSVWFMAIKLALVSLGSYLLWIHRHRRVAVIGLGSLAAVYCCLAAYHLETVDQLARHLWRAASPIG